MPEVQEENPNTNCLEGKRCPKCGSYGPFQISCKVWKTLHDGGTDDPDKMHGDTEYDDTDLAICDDCSHESKWGDFNDPAAEEDEEAVSFVDCTPTTTMTCLHCGQDDEFQNGKVCDVCKKWTCPACVNVHHHRPAIDQIRDLLPGLSEAEALTVYNDLCDAKHLRGSVFVRSDFEDRAGRQLTDEEWLKVQATWYWRKGIPEQLTSAGWTLVTGALRDVRVI